MSEQTLDDNPTPQLEGISINLPEHLTKLAETPELENDVVEVIEKLDKTSFMAAVRKGWDAMPAIFQNVVLRLPSLLPQIMLLKGLVKIGLLKPKDPNLSIQDVSKTDEVIQRIALWLAKKLVPEMKVFDETVDPLLQKLGFKNGLEGFIELQKSLSEDFYTRIRGRLDIAHLQKEVGKRTTLTVLPSQASTKKPQEKAQFKTYRLPNMGEWYVPLDEAA